jgi:hypothetical protein
LKGFPDSVLRLASGRRIQMGSKLGEEEIVENRPVHLRHSDVATAQHTFYALQQHTAYSTYAHSRIHSFHACGLRGDALASNAQWELVREEERGGYKISQGSG